MVETMETMGLGSRGRPAGGAGRLGHWKGRLNRPLRPLALAFALTLGLSGCSLVDVAVDPPPVARDHPKAGEALIYFLRDQQSEATIPLPGMPGSLSTGIGHDLRHAFALPNHGYLVLAVPAGPAKLTVGHKTLQQNFQPGVTYYFLVFQYVDSTAPSVYPPHFWAHADIVALAPARAKAKLPHLRRVILSNGATSGAPGA